MKDILLSHALRYPRMEPTDGVKIIYQNEFGGGHLIRDEEACREYLRREFAATAKDMRIPLAEDIGNGIVRVNLGALEDTYWLEEAFLRSAREHRGCLESFEGKLEILRELTGEGAFAFSLPELDGYLEEYRAEGYPPVSHSHYYRETYHPAYRVILKKYLPR